MNSVVVLLLVAVVVLGVTSFVWNRREGLVAKRGTSSGADLGALSDQPRVRIAEFTDTGADRVRIEFKPEPESLQTLEAGLDVVVALSPSDFGFGVLEQWAQTGAVLAIVMPAGSRIVRLRSIEDLQPVTLRRVDI